jgi:hypothetical protein
VSNQNSVSSRASQRSLLKGFCVDAPSNAAHVLIFGDIEGKLDVLRVERNKCGRKGRYQVHKLTWRQQHGATAAL